MRIFVLLALAIFIAPTVLSSEAQPRDALAVSTYTIDEKTALISWSPAPGATSYQILRGPSPDDVTLIGTSVTTLFHDATAPTEEAWYVILSVHLAGGNIEAIGEARGHCLKLKGSTGLSLTMAHCLPTRPV